MQIFNFSKITPFLKKKWVIIPVVVILIFVGFKILGGKNNENITIIEPTFGTLNQTVQATGQITSNVDIGLSFKKQGIVKTIKVGVGDKVKEGQILATLEAGSLYADVLSANATLLSAQAKLKKVLEGATNEEIEVAKASLATAKSDLENTKITQATLVKNAYRKLLNSTLEAKAQGSYSVTAPTISGYYNSDKEGYIEINVYNTSGGASFSISGLANGTGSVNTSLAQPLGNTGLSILFASESGIGNTTWRVYLPNKEATDYLTNLNAYESALRTQDSVISSAESLVREREASLALKQAKARESEVSLAEAEVLSAQALLQKAQSAYDDAVIRAPAPGTITKIDLKYGEIIEAGKTAIVLQDIENLYVESSINESNIVNVALDQSVDIYVDALPELKFAGKVSSIDISSDTNDGIVNYKIKIAILEKNENIRPGMNTEITIFTGSKENVLSVPEASLVKRDGKTFVNVITNEKRKKYIEQEISVGVKGDGNMIEVLSGVSSGQKIAIVSKK